MPRQSLFAAAVLLGTCALMAAGLDRQAEPTAVKPAATSRLLPGIQAGGSVLLPNQWSLQPAGRQLVVGDFPVNLALHPGGRRIIQVERIDFGAIGAIRIGPAHEIQGAIQPRKRSRAACAR